MGDRCLSSLFLYSALNWTVRFFICLSSFVGRLNSGRRGLVCSTDHSLSILREGILNISFYFDSSPLPLSLPSHGHVPATAPSGFGSKRMPSINRTSATDCRSGLAGGAGLGTARLHRWCNYLRVSYTPLLYYHQHQTTRILHWTVRFDREIPTLHSALTIYSTALSSVDSTCSV